MARVDVESEILGNQQIECPFCHVVEKMKEFGRWVADRAGLKIVHCSCKTCSGKWKRIETK